MELLIGHHVDKGDSSSSNAGRGVGSVAPAAADLKSSGGAVLTKDQRVEKGRFMNRVANMNPERRLKKLLSDRYANMSEERRAKKKESNRLLNRPENMSLERRMRKRLSDSAAQMSVERKEKKKESQRKRNLNKVKVPRVPLSGEKRELKNERGKVRRAAKKAATQTGQKGGVKNLVQVPEFSNSPTSSSLSSCIPLSLGELPLPCDHMAGSAQGIVSHDGERDIGNNNNNSSSSSSNSNRTNQCDEIAFNNNMNDDMDIISNNDIALMNDSDSDEGENEEDNNEEDENIDDVNNGNKSSNDSTNNLDRTIPAAVPVEDETDHNNMISYLDNASNSRGGDDLYPLRLPLHSPLTMIESESDLAFKDDNDLYSAQPSHPLSRKRNRAIKDK